MRALLLSSAIILVSSTANAEPQCTVPPTSDVQASSRAAQGNQPAAPLLPSAAEARPVLVATGAPALDHVVAAGARIADLGVSHGLRTVVAHADGQFMRMYVAPDGQALIAGLMADLSVAQLLEMAPGHVTELGTLHGLRGLFVRNGSHFQVFYATPDEERVIPGAMWDAQGKNLTRDQLAAIPGAVPTVMIGDAPVPASQAITAPRLASAGSLLKVVEGTTFGTVGSPSAPRLWMLVDPLCAWSVRAMEQLRPYVANGRVQVAAVPVSVLDREPSGRSTLAAKTMLSLPSDAMVAAWSDNKLTGPVEAAADGRLAANMGAAAAIGLRGTPTLLWRKADGTEGRADGLPKDLDVLIASIAR